MIATIIGADGKMGVWLTNHLSKMGHTIVSFDARKGDSSSILKEADAVIVSVPVSKTAEETRNALKHMRKGARIIEIASLKTGTYPEMVKAEEQGFESLSIHPMFGPSVKNLSEKTVAVIPVVDADKETRWAAELFPGASFVEVGPEKHDRLMVHVLSLPYLMNLALGATMGDTDLALLNKLAGTSFALQYTLIQSVSGETTSLVHALLSENVFLEETAEELISNMRALMGARDAMNEFKALHESIREPLRADCGHRSALERRQAAYNAVRPLLK
ncbi:prephenate dehydrogenase/arogenate dehydrogenase family protein [Candidatus Bathyarchaeota archaeon]|jgi:prephenate dehydrogenase|nr:prephenate dehydrogenase/arogenate dehydrogenase family protein [Candidatus Bathyarchaeota archaeon]MBT4320839.1 prephenate dehydrogenase/arogenate dehydrogenase family protein [Candidatus Bathyarchaeota archaeon]MBT4423113.1 prephenate dehydrogenase/arogenate dehydrogenase family protein [Candidatus Bathyarchaeota archaeon]MBT5643429.1 prephenate dehydrogenase/arogenate dehydrogenase family protein [Candidatus Bathyarchaeota archaeon]MBT6605489.1 prephenate dehydrogenase/arogenate dehydroge